MHRAAAQLAGRLVGLTSDEAVRKIRDCGFEPEVHPHSVTMVHASLKYSRIRIWVNDDGQVIDAVAG